MASAVPSQGQQLQPPPSVVPGDSIADSYDPAQVRAANLSRAEALMSQQQRQLPQQQQPSPNTVIQQQHQFQQQVNQLDLPILRSDLLGYLTVKKS